MPHDLAETQRPLTPATQHLAPLPEGLEQLEAGREQDPLRYGHNAVFRLLTAQPE